MVVIYIAIAVMCLAIVFVLFSFCVSSKRASELCYEYADVDERIDNTDEGTIVMDVSAKEFDSVNKIYIRYGMLCKTFVLRDGE